MVQTLDNIKLQAHQGSIAAIIQVLNERLAILGVRSRAVMAQGVLQLLCEANEAGKLEQSKLIEQLRTTLNELRPRYIRRVRVNARIVSEQQLLWLDEIERDPEGQLLWSAEFRLSRPSIKQVVGDAWTRWQVSQHPPGLVLADTARRERARRRVIQTTVGLGGGAVFLFLLGWVFYDSFGSPQRLFSRLGTSRSVDAPQASPELTRAEPGQDPGNPLVTQPQDPAGAGLGGAAPQETLLLVEENPGEENIDPFAQAVRLAEQSVADGQVATTVDEWMELAAQWQRASELMQQITADDDRYAIAQNRTTVYLQNSVDSRKQAELVRQEQDESAAQPL